MSHGYTTAVRLNASQGHSTAFDHAWNPYTTEDEWGHYTSTEISENLPDFDESVLEQFIHENEAAMMSPDSQMHEASSARSPPSEQVIVSSPSYTQSSGAVPVCTPYPGDYGFVVTLEKQVKKTKSANWIYYPDLHKLFVKINKPCPFLFKTAKRPPPDSFIRALPVFLNPEHIQEVVRRCPTHRAERIGGGGGGAEPTTAALTQHMVLSEHQLARHVEDSCTHRLSVVTPYEEPQAGAEWVTSLYRFMCFSSCHSGYSRRPLHVIFTLERHGQVLGRQVIKVRCCASPGRDGCQEEESLLGGGGGKRKRKAASQEEVVLPDAKRQRAGGGGGRGGAEEIFTIQVRGRENYETLRQLRDSLELVEQLPSEVVAHFRWQQMEQDRWSLSNEQRNTEEVQGPTLPPLPPLTPLTSPVPPPMSAAPPPSSDKTRKKPLTPIGSVAGAALSFSASGVVSQVPMYF